jgi:hypothetical protein
MLVCAARPKLACAVHRVIRTMEVPIEISGAVCGACGKPVRMAAVLYTANARLLCPLCFTKADIAARPRAGFEGGAVALVGAIAAAIPFVAQAAASLMVAAGGASRHDWVALAGGVVAAVCGGSTIVSARARASGGWLMVGALVAVLGAYHLARGAGLVG